VVGKDVMPCMLNSLHIQIKRTSGDILCQVWRVQSDKLITTILATSMVVPHPPDFVRRQTGYAGNNKIRFWLFWHPNW